MIFRAFMFLGMADARPLKHDHNRYRLLRGFYADDCLRAAFRCATPRTKTKRPRPDGGAAGSIQKGRPPGAAHALEGAWRHGSFGVRSLSQQSFK